MNNSIASRAPVLAMAPRLITGFVALRSARLSVRDGSAHVGGAAGANRTALKRCKDVNRGKCKDVPGHSGEDTWGTWTSFHDSNDDSMASRILSLLLSVSL